jgi:hypothetical protein
MHGELRKLRCRNRKCKGSVNIAINGSVKDQTVHNHRPIDYTFKNLEIKLQINTRANAGSERLHDIVIDNIKI